MTDYLIWHKFSITKTVFSIFFTIDENYDRVITWTKKRNTTWKHLRKVRGEPLNSGVPCTEHQPPGTQFYERVWLAVVRMRNKLKCIWKDGSMEAWKDSRIEGWKDGSPRGMEGWDGPSQPPYYCRFVHDYVIAHSHNGILYMCCKGSAPQSPNCNAHMPTACAVQRSLLTVYNQTGRRHTLSIAGSSSTIISTEYFYPLLNQYCDCTHPQSFIVLWWSQALIHTSL